MCNVSLRREDILFSPITQGVKQYQEVDGWPESETGDCPALSNKELVHIELSKSHDLFILRERKKDRKKEREREREGGCEGVTVWMYKCDIDVCADVWVCGGG